MNKVQKRKIIGVAVISGVILVSVASVGAVKLVKEANATEVNKYVTAKNTDYNSTSYTAIRTVNVNNGGETEGGTNVVKVCVEFGTNGKYFFMIDEKSQMDGAIFEVPSKAGSTFIGYFDQDGNEICGSDGIIHTDFMPGGSKTPNVTQINAKWELNEAMEIKLKLEGGTGGPSTLYLKNSKFYYDKELTNEVTKIDVPTKVGNTFGGYCYVYYDDSLSMDVYIKIITKEGYITEDIDILEEKSVNEIFADWNSIDDVIIDKNGGTGGTNQLYKNAGKLYLDSKVTIEANNIIVPSKEGYTFNGYYYYDRDDDNKVEMISKDGIVNKENVFLKLNGLGLKLYAEWKPNVYTYTLNRQDEDGNIDYLYCIFEKGLYTYSDNEYYFAGTSMKVPKRNGYTFGGYYTLPDGEGEQLIKENGYFSYNLRYEYTCIAQDVTMYAKWNKIHEIELDPGEGIGGTETIYIAGTKAYKDSDATKEITEITMPTRTGYTFKGYYVNVGEDLEIIKEDGTVNSDNIGVYNNSSTPKTLIAKWEENEVESSIQTIRLKDDKNDTTSSIYLKDGKVYSDEMCITEITKIEVPIKYGYQFKGFKYNGITIVDSDGNIAIDKINQIHTHYTDDYEAEAEWIEEKFVIHYDANGGEGAPKDSEFYVMMVKKIDSAIPTKLGYTFVEWNTDINGGGTKYHPSQQVSFDNNGEITLYAQWIKNEDENVAVTGIEVTPTSSEIKVGGTATITATVKPDNATNKNVTWSSSDSDVATVSNGVVTGKSEGTATITATTVDGNYTAEATITVKQDIEDTKGPTISSVKGEKDSDGKYKVVIKVTDESGIEKILVNGTEITTKDDEGNYYFIPTQNGEYKIEAFDTVNNKKEYIYTETRITESGEDNDDNGNAGNNGNTGNSDNDGNNGNTGNTGNFGNGTIGNKNNLNNLNNNGSNNTTGKTGDTITTSTALTKLPKTGTTMGALFAAIASGISAVIAWFKHKKMKQ